MLFDSFILTALVIMAGVFGTGGWILFNLAVDQRYDCPTLQKIAHWGNVIIIVVVLAIIIKYDLWC